MLKKKKLCDLLAWQVVGLSARCFVWALSLMFVLSLGSCSKETTDDYVINGNTLRFSVVKANGWNTRQQSRAAESEHDVAESWQAAELKLAGTAPTDSIAGIFPLNGESPSDTLFLHASVTNGIINSNPNTNTNSLQTRATPVEEDTFYDSFGVFASVYTGDWDEDSCLPNYIYNEEVTKASSWTTSYYWPGAGRKIRFFAYAPYNGEGINLSTKTRNGTPFITYIVPEDASNQQDLLIAVPIEKAGDARTEISLSFNHALTAVRFVTGNILAGKITKITLKGVCSVASLQIKDGAKWSIHSSLVKDFSQTLSSTVTGTSGEEIIPTESTFMMIPQTLPSGAKIEIAYKDDATGTSRTLSADIGGSEWPVGKSVTYTISASSIIKTTEFLITEPSATYKGGNTEYSVTRYATVYTTGGNSTSVPIKWKAEFVEEDSNGNYIVIPKPEWVTAFTESGNGGTSATTFSATIAAQTGVTSNPHNETLKTAASVSGTYDLSTSGGTTAMRTANCYLINAPGTYSLPLVYGNAIKNGETNTSAYKSTASGDYILKNFVNHLNAAITDPYIYNNAGCTPLDAVLVWQDEENLVTNVRLSSDKHSLTFDVPQATIKQGNAIVAVRDTDSRIMWSWHIWVTDYRLGEDIKTVTNYQGIAYKMMPVNIGWCDAETTTYDARSVKVRFTQAETGAKQVITLTQASHSVVNSGNQPFFQFGRKDPMLAGIRNASGTSVDKGCYSDGYAFNASEGNVSIGISIQHPHIFYNFGNSVVNDWCATSYYNLWSANNTVTTTNDNAVVKTIYDPSPVGYHLPSSNAFTGFTYNGGNITGPPVGSLINTPYTSSADFTDNFGWKFYCNKMTGNGIYDTAGGTIFFPASGYRNNSIGGIANIGKYCCVWTAVPASASYGRFMSVMPSYVNPRHYTARVFCFAVRPVQE